MIAKNYIRYPEALRYQVELFSNGYHNSPRIMRLMQVIFNWKATVPTWVKEAAVRMKALVKRWKSMQVCLNFKRPENAAAPEKSEWEKLEDHIHSTDWAPVFTPGEIAERDGSTVQYLR